MTGISAALFSAARVFFLYSAWSMFVTESCKILSALHMCQNHPAPEKFRSIPYLRMANQEWGAVRR